MFRQRETTCFSLEYVKLFWLKFLQNTQHLACKVSDPTAEFWQKVIHVKWSISQPRQWVLLAPYILISKKEERYKVAGCQITEPADGTQQTCDSNWPLVDYVVPQEIECIARRKKMVQIYTEFFCTKLLAKT